MPHRLPDELLLLIFDALAQPAYSRDEYKRRQQALSALSLVGRRYRDLAQPLLWEVVRAQERAHLDKIRRIKDGNGSPTRTKLFHVSTKTVATGEEEPVSPDEGIEAAKLFPDVEEIRIECVRSPLDLTLLDAHCGLHRLSLVNVDLSSSSPVHLPHLEQLRLDRTIIPSSLLTAWLDPSHLPSLAAVRLVALYEALHVGAPALDFSPAFLAQVDFIQTPGLSLDALQRYHNSIDPPFLFGSSLSSILPRHLVLAAHQFDGRARATTTLKRFGTQVDAAPPIEGSHPRVLLLPRCLQALATSDEVVATVLDTFVATCARKDARLIWHAGAEDDLVSREFWRYARQLKAAREEEEECGRKL
ncbi:hypothetical protein JCM10450v2_003293 [Rhodotorula kratochvilovae]